MSQQDTETMSTLIVSLLYLLYAILILAAQWKMYQKMGRKGWESLVPFRNIYVIFEELYADGWKMLLLLIPFYRLYLTVKCCIDLSRAFGKSVGFGLGMAFFSPIFFCLLGFGNAVYQSPHPRPAEALPSESVTVYVDLKRNREAAQDLRDLTWMKQTGEISEDTYEEIKSKLLRQL